MNDPTTTPLPPTSAETVTSKASQAIIGAHDVAIEQIDSMITELQSIKATIAARKDEAVARLKEFIGTVDGGLQGIKALKITMEKVHTEYLSRPTV